jgi:hypothetical protein
MEEIMNTYRISTGKPVGRTKRWDDSIRMYLKER